MQNSEAIKILRQFLCTGHINHQNMYGFWKCLPSCIDRAGVRSVIHAIGGFRVAYQALPRSLVAKLEAMDGGRPSARTGRPPSIQTGRIKGCFTLKSARRAI